MTLTKEYVEPKLTSAIEEGKLRCFKCGAPLNGSNIEGLQLNAADGKPKVLYLCDTPMCPNSTKLGYRTLLSLGIVDQLESIDEDSPLANAQAPEGIEPGGITIMTPDGPRLLLPDDESDDSGDLEDQVL